MPLVTLLLKENNENDIFGTIESWAELGVFEFKGCTSYSKWKGKIM